MQRHADSFDLAELARAADVTPRTIRYYVQQGLIPAPGTRGPSTRYDAGHLARLLLIKRWQRLHLPLAEVRKRLEGMSDAEVRVALAEFPPDPPPDEPRARSTGGHDALSYVRSLLQRGEGSIPMASQAPLPPQPAFAQRPSRFAGAAPAEAPEAEIAREDEGDEEFDELSEGEARLLVSPDSSAAEEGSASPQDARPIAAPLRSTWERLALTPDIELHLRRPLTRDDNRRVERLIEFARRLLREEV